MNNGCKWCAMGQCWGCKSTGKGGGKGKGGGGWGGGGGVQNFQMKQMMQMMQMMQGGKGKGRSGGGLKSFDGKLRVWIGGLPQKGEPDDALNKQLKEHMGSSGLKCTYAQVGKNGMGGAVFGSEAEAEQAIATMNGTIFEGAIIQVDKLTKGNK
eukprot:CAMPEP_0197660592 /NCGR_PEP_ID=MMETSP1338-20131121/50939_1 /TAXON_ID=43686 ORGANISM="Pelagodinium beii, Strain RCC1491" /NCGR_SAMPLE_ID=MMETSP1338 /ASSEMBLY_ACC=CAM_ASM_000754 /LENGTH=153 /DNA_ID=CAMNT_0043237971 /DNA_START=103 /DNA_END=564 /DNA_ORIENTATION=-